MNQKGQFDWETRTMTSDALLAAILADPADDLPRLAYADWCEEHANVEQATFIRRHLDSKEDTVVQLLACEGTGIWQRGFMYRVKCSLFNWLRHGPLLVRQHPIEQVDLDRVPYPSRDNPGLVFWSMFGRSYIARPGSSLYCLPEFWHKHMKGKVPGNRLVEPQGHDSRLVYYRSADAAMIAASLAALSWAKMPSAVKYAISLQVSDKKKGI